MLFLNRRNKNKYLGNNEKNCLTIKELFKEINADKKYFFNIFTKSKIFYNNIDNHFFTRCFKYNNHNIILINDNEKTYFNIVNVKNEKELEKLSKKISEEIIEIKYKFLKSIDLF